MSKKSDSCLVRGHTHAQKFHLRRLRSMDNTWAPSGSHVLKFQFWGEVEGGGYGPLGHLCTHSLCSWSFHCILNILSQSWRAWALCTACKAIARKFLWSVYRHFKMLRSQASLAGVVNICESGALAPDHRLAQGVSTSPDRLPKGYFNCKPPLTVEGITTNKALSLIVVEFCYPAKPNL